MVNYYAVVKMEENLMYQHDDSHELTDLLIQLEVRGVSLAGNIRRTNSFCALAGSPFAKKGLTNLDFDYGIVIPTIPNVDFRVKKLSQDARTSECYEFYGKGKHNLLDGRGYYNFTQNLSSEITLPEGWKFIPPQFVGFAVNDYRPGSVEPFYPDTSFSSFSVRRLVGDGCDELKKSVNGGILCGVGHFSEEKVLFPIYEPAVIGRMYREGMIEARFINSEGKSKQIQGSSKNVNCLEVIAIYPNKVVLDKSASSPFDNLVRPFLTFHPDYQFKWLATAERHAAFERRRLQHPIG